MLYNQHNLNVSKIASTSDIRPELASVFCTDTKTVATDGYRLLEMSIPSNAVMEEFTGAGKKPMKGCEPFMISAKALSKVKIIKNKTLSGTEYVGLGHLDDKKAELLTIDDSLNVQTHTINRVAGTYPDYAKIIPQGKPIIEVQVNGEYLAELLTILSKLDATKKVVIKLYGENRPIVLEAEDVNNKQHGTGVLMPLRS